MADSRLPFNLFDLPEENAYLATGRAALVASEIKACKAVCMETAFLGDGEALPPALPNAFTDDCRLHPFSDCLSLLGSATGLALTGHRASALMHAADLGRCMDKIASMVAHRVPLLVHTLLRGCGVQPPSVPDVHHLFSLCGGLGVFQITPRSVQEAIDMTFIARKLSETALTPGMIGIDAQQTGYVPQEFHLPTDAIIGQFLGRTSQAQTSPNAAQRLIFGEHRPTMPRWFSLNRPVASNWAMAQGDVFLARRGQEHFFHNHLVDLATQVMQEWTKITGRQCGLVSRFMLDDADTVLVAQGADIPAAEGAVQALRRNKRTKVGVLGIVWTTPFPSDAIRTALTRCSRAIVLDRHPAGGLTDQLTSALSGPNSSVESAYIGHSPIALGDISTLLEQDTQHGAKRFVVTQAPQGAPGFPKSEYIFQEVKREYPDLIEGMIAPRESDAQTTHTRAIAFLVRDWEWRDASLTALSRAMRQDASSAVSGHVRPVGTDWLEGSFVAAPKQDKTSTTASANVIFISDIDLPETVNPFDRLAAHGTAVFASRLGKDAFASMLPAAWQDALNEKGVRCLLYSGSNLLDRAAELLPHLEANDLPTDLEAFSPKFADHRPSRPPYFLERADSGSAYDNIPRFWSETLQPRIEGHADQATPDPSHCLGRIPAGTAAFADGSRQSEWMPEIDPEQGPISADSYLACPDSAFGVAVLNTEQLLQACLDQIRDDLTEGADVFDKFKRASKNLAKKIDGALVKAQAHHLPLSIVEESTTWLIDKMKLADGERFKYGDIFDHLSRLLKPLPIFVTDEFFHTREKAQKGSGELSVVVINPAACKGCGLCHWNASPSGIRMVPKNAELIDSMTRNWRVFERLPDTSGKTMAHARDQQHLLAGLFLSRHCAQAMSPSAGGAPGCGGRLAVRLLTGIAEFVTQTRAERFAKKVAERENALHEKMRESLTSAIPVDDLESLQRVLEKMPAHRSAFSEVIAKLDASGQSTTVDGRNVKEMAGMAQDMRNLHWELTTGPSGFGRARYGAVVALKHQQEETVFPFNPFQTPVLAECSGDLDVALGLMAGLVDTHVAEMAALRTADKSVASSAVAALEDPELKRLDWADLTAEEKDLCPPIIVFVGGSVADASRGIPRLVERDWPLKLVILDDMDLTKDRVPASALALARPKSFVASTSIAHLDHFGRVVRQALAFAGPAVLHMYTPHPKQHGFAADVTLAQARAAVDCHLHPLMVFQGGDDGVFGTELDLSGNPEDADDTQEHKACSVADWAFAQSRYRHWFRKLDDPASAPPNCGLEEWVSSDAVTRRDKTATYTDVNGDTYLLAPQLSEAARRADRNFTILRELAGLESPFVDRIRSQVDREIQAIYEGKVADLEAAHREEIRAVQQEQRQVQASQLANRLLHLAGLTPPNDKPGDNS